MTQSDMAKTISHIIANLAELEAEDENALLFVYFRGHSFVDDAGFAQTVLGNQETNKLRRTFALC